LKFYATIPVMRVCKVFFWVCIATAAMFGLDEYSEVRGHEASEMETRILRRSSLDLSLRTPTSCELGSPGLRSLSIRARGPSFDQVFVSPKERSLHTFSTCRLRI
jgi:hypothetical protein